MGKNYYSKDEEGNLPECYPVEWFVCWGDYPPVRVWARLAQEARVQGVRILTEQIQPTERKRMVWGNELDVSVPIPVMEVTAEHVFKSHQIGATSYIIDVVCEYYGVEPEKLLNGKGTKTLQQARRVACYLARELTEASWPEISGEFDRDHTSCMAGYNTVKAKLNDITTLEKNGVMLSKSLIRLKEDLKQLRRKFPR